MTGKAFRRLLSLQWDCLHRPKVLIVWVVQTYHDFPHTEHIQNKFTIYRLRSHQVIFLLTVKYDLPSIVPLLRPFGSFSATPAHLPEAKFVIPKNAISPRTFLPATSTFWPKRSFGSDILPKCLDSLHRITCNAMKYRRTDVITVN